MNKMIKIEDIENKIIELRNKKVVLDSDVAELYGVETKRVNEVVKNNSDKFPNNYIFKLNKNEWNVLKSKFSTSIKGGKTKLPTAFTEKGLYMLATILKSKKAIATTFAIIETFTKIKELSHSIKELSTINDKKQQKNLMQKSGEIIFDILGDSLPGDESETSIEINFAVLKFKHTVKNKKS